jgi:hypothetical protein
VAAVAAQRSSTASGCLNGMKFLLKFTYSPCKFQIEYKKSVCITENLAMQCALQLHLQLQQQFQGIPEFYQICMIRSDECSM